MNTSEINKNQKEVCDKYNVQLFGTSINEKMGVSKNLLNGELPINGLRHYPKNGTTGWYIWAGEYSEAIDFFEPMHIYHLGEKFPQLLKYLGLPPGYRFQIDNKGYEDVWYDEKLIN